MRVTAAESWGTRPSESTAVSTETVAATASATSARPAPWVVTGMSASASLVDTRRALSSSGSHCGCWAARIAAAPATCGVAIEVPLIDV